MGLLARESMNNIVNIDEIREYEELLSCFDWYYSYQDVHSDWKRGSDQHRRLMVYREKLDKDNKIWNKYAPDEFKAKPK